MENSPVIDNLMKVTLEIRKGVSPSDIDLNSLPVQVIFVYGVGSSGLTEIEYALSGKKEGDTVTVAVSPDTFHAMFSHLSCQFHDVFGHVTDTCFLSMKVTGIVPAENREIVKAMAGTGSCSGGCDCGCGC